MLSMLLLPETKTICCYLFIFLINTISRLGKNVIFLFIFLHFHLPNHFFRLTHAVTHFTPYTQTSYTLYVTHVCNVTFLRFVTKYIYFCLIFSSLISYFLFYICLTLFRFFLYVNSFFCAIRWISKNLVTEEKNWSIALMLFEVFFFGKISIYWKR